MIPGVLKVRCLKTYNSKWINSDGYICYELGKDKISDDSIYMLECFRHYDVVYHTSNALVDPQGEVTSSICEFIHIIDPLFTSFRRRSSKESFMKTHQCNKFCRIMGLKNWGK